MLEVLTGGVNSNVVDLGPSHSCIQRSFRRGGVVAQWQMPTGENPVRTAVRFPMRLSIRLQTDQGEMEAMTENISANGLLFVGEQLPAVESRIEFTIAMPSSVMGTTKDVTIHCIGRVVRHYLQGGQKKAAAVIDEYSLKA
jgi:PilZ domain